MLDHPLQQAKVILLGVPYDGDPEETVGSRFAPNAIRKDLKEILEEPLPVHDAGNIKPVKKDEKLTHHVIRNKVKELHEQKPKARIIVLGGEHSITPAIVEAIQPPNYLCFDLKWDLQPPTHPMENKSVNRRIIGMGVNTEVLGARLGTPDEKRLGPTLGKTGNPVYVSIDLDVLQGVPVSTGFSGKMGLKELWEEIENRQVIACDLTEYNPLLGKSQVPAQIVKKLIQKMCVEY